MSLTKKMQEQRGKPSGLFGTIIGKFMNIFHGNIDEWGLQNCSFNENYICLDIGCGGGNAVKAIAEKVTKGKVSYQYGNLRAEEERMDYLEFIARVTSHIPDKGQVTLRYYGLYSNAHRGKMRKKGVDPSHPPIIEDETLFVLSRGWTEMIRKVYQVDPLICPQCGVG